MTFVPTSVSRAEVLRRALAEAGLTATGDEGNDEDALLGFLVDIARSPELLGRLLEGVPDAKEIQRRFEFAVAPADASGMYLQIVQTLPLDVTSAERWIAAHYQAMVPFGLELPGPIAVRWVDELPAASASEWSFDDECYQVTGDVLREAASDSDHPAFALHEAAYGLAAQYELSHYVLWPAHRTALAAVGTPGAIELSRGDPFLPWVHLWHGGIEWRWIPEHGIHARGAGPKS